MTAARLRRWTVVAAAAAAAAAASVSATPGAASACPAGSVRAVIGGKHVCLRAGQTCRRALDRQYHRYGFHCHGARLTRAAAAPAANLLLAAEPAPQPSLGRAAFALEVTNLGPSSSGPVTLVASVTGAAVVSAAAEGGSCATEGPRVTCRFGALPVGGRGAATIAVRPAGAGPVTVTASVSGTTRDPSPGNNATSATGVVPPGDVVRGAGARSAFHGGTFRFELDAWSGPNGEAPGGTFRIQIQGDAGVATAQGSVLCVGVAGNRAAVGGFVDVTNDGATFGRHVILFVTDNGPAGDTSIALLNVEPFAGCGYRGDLPHLPLVEGDFVVSDAEG